MPAGTQFVADFYSKVAVVGTIPFMLRTTCQSHERHRTGGIDITRGWYHKLDNNHKSRGSDDAKLSILITTGAQHIRTHCSINPPSLPPSKSPRPPAVVGQHHLSNSLERILLAHKFHRQCQGRGIRASAEAGENGVLSVGRREGGGAY